MIADSYEKEWVNFKGKTVGWISDKVYHTHRRPDTFFKKYQSFGLSEELIFYLQKKGVDTVVIHYSGKEQPLLFIVPLDKFFEGRVWYDGNDKQYHLKAREMQCFAVKEIGGDDE